MADEPAAGIGQEGGKEQLKKDRERVDPEARKVLAQQQESTGGQAVAARRALLNVQELLHALQLFKPDYVPKKKNGQAVASCPVADIVKAWMDALDGVSLPKPLQQKPGATKGTPANVRASAAGDRYKELSGQDLSDAANREQIERQLDDWKKSQGDGFWKASNEESGALRIDLVPTCLPACQSCQSCLWCQHLLTLPPLFKPSRRLG